ncbi:MAG: DUF3575 domain-containing protein [Bacteroidales bacterium]|nr:DUF3575 domain-containing protein [Bacteroidales bacterium]
MKRLIIIVLALIPVLSRAEVDPAAVVGPGTVTVIDTTVVRGQTRINKAAIYFRYDESSFQESYHENAAVTRQLVDFLHTIGLEKIDSVTVVAFASPEGQYDYNLDLSRKRAGSISEILSSIDGSGPGVPIKVEAGGEAWDQLRVRVVADKNLSSEDKMKILGILDDPALSREDMKARFTNGALGESEAVGDIYRYLKNEVYTYLRYMEITIHYVDTPEQIPEETPQEEVPILFQPVVAADAVSDVAAAVDTVEAVQEQAWRPVLGLSTNIPYDITWVPQYGLTSIPSFSLEYYPATGKYTFGCDVEWPMWRHPSEHRYMQINNLTLWTRRYFKREDDRFDGLYLLGNVNAARYGIGFNAEKGWEGEGLGASLGAGYKVYLGKHVYLDAGLALGLFYSWYDPYVWGNDATGRYYYDYYGDPDDFIRRNKRLVWAGPTRVYISVGIDIFGKKK